jgi:N-acetylmuramoyl-L-alanine amidase
VILTRAIRLIGLIIFSFCWSIPVQAENADQPVIVLDPGHTPAKQGVLGARGIYEVHYNDQFVAKLAKALRAASFHVVVTRSPDESIGLLERAQLANAIHPMLFLSIHHDSAQLIYLNKIQYADLEAYQTNKRIEGYSIFTSTTNPQFADSYRFAELLGQSLIKLKRPPTLHHAEKIAGESRELLDENLGIYRFDNLVVLAKTNVPAVLLEVGVIVDSNDERYVSDTHNQDAMCAGIVEAVQKYADLAHGMHPQK